MDADRNLLFGILALQADLIDSGQFVEVCSLWTRRKTVPLADLLIERGWILPTDREHVDYLLGRKLQKCGGGVRASLGSVPDDVKRSLAALGDADIHRSLAGLPQSCSRVSAETVNYVAQVSAETVNHVAQLHERYTLTRLHAIGGIGRIWLAHDSALGRHVALKELRPERADDATLWARFLKEARITGQLEHPGIVPVYELARRPETQQPFYTMRFVKGRTLAEAIRAYHARRAEGRVDSLELLTLLNAFITVCNTVAYAHSRGVIHRDLKGQNVVLGDFGEVVVLDWGLAKLLDRVEAEDQTISDALLPEGSAETDFTLAGQALGTPAYMAPEQAAGRLDLIDRRTDVYGLGAILYELLTGQPPFHGSDAREVLRKVQEEEPPTPRQFCPDVHPRLEAVCLRALAKRCADRHDSATELAQEIQGWQDLQRRQAEEALRQSEALYHSLVEMLPLTVWRKDLAGRFTFVNKRLCAATGRSLSDLIGKTDFDLFPPELAEKYRQDDRWVMAHGRTLELVEENVTPKGQRLHVHVVKTPVLDGHGKVVGTQGIFWDVTESDQLQHALAEVSAELGAAKQQLQQREPGSGTSSLR